MVGISFGEWIILGYFILAAVESKLCSKLWNVFIKWIRGKKK
jgi:hypothetical protein